MPLVRIKCHQDTQLFLCSLFAPICLDQPIYPCRSLCESVKNGCEARMNAYSYQWPAMFNCSKFPDDNGLCIQPESSANDVKNEKPVVLTTTKKPTNPPSTMITTTKLQTTSKTRTTTATAGITRNISKSTTVSKKTQKKPIKNNKTDDECTGCTGINSEENIIEMFCKSDIGKLFILFF